MFGQSLVLLFIIVSYQNMFSIHVQCVFPAFDDFSKSIKVLIQMDLRSPPRTTSILPLIIRHAHRRRLFRHHQREWDGTTMDMGVWNTQNRYLNKIIIGFCYDPHWDTLGYLKWWPANYIRHFSHFLFSTKLKNLIVIYVLKCIACNLIFVTQLALTMCWHSRKTVCVDLWSSSGIVHCVVARPHHKRRSCSV